jgi:DNA-directed RNA polymerase subunit alpha
MDGVTQLDQIVSKEAWTQEDCQQLGRLILEVKDPANRLRELLARLTAGKTELGGTEAVKVGIARHFLCQFAEAADVLGKATDNKERRFYQGLCQKQLRQYDKALENLQYAEDRGWDPRQVALEKAEVQCLAGDLAGAAKTLERFAKSSQLDADWHHLNGLVNQMQGRYEQAVAAYETARRLVPGHVGATFRLAYFYDLHGDEEAAIELYRQCVNRLEGQEPDARPVHANALLNLAVLYEDAGRYDEAARCLRRLLAANPSHARARLFLKDVLASKTMTFDEDEAKRLAKRNDLLSIPVTDFELSVRARNCLKKMNINNLGDLLHVTEPELLSYKNFGETSLAEIKGMLSSKNLHLGQLREEGAVPSAPEAPEEAVIENEGVLATPVAQIEFSVRARRALEMLEVKTLGDLAAKTEPELLGCRNFGQTSLNEIVQRLAEYGLRLREGT